MPDLIRDLPQFSAHDIGSCSVSLNYLVNMVLGGDISFTVTVTEWRRIRQNTCIENEFGCMCKKQLCCFPILIISSQVRNTFKEASIGSSLAQ